MRMENGSIDFQVFFFYPCAEKGQLYTFGDGRHGKLGLGMESFANQFKPSRVERFSKFIVNSVSKYLKKSIF